MVVVVVYGESRQISRSRYLISMRVVNTVDICEKLVSVRFESLNMAHKQYSASSVQHACGLTTQVGR